MRDHSRDRNGLFWIGMGVGAIALGPIGMLATAAIGACADEWVNENRHKHDPQTAIEADLAEPEFSLQDAVDEINASQLKLSIKQRSHLRKNGYKETIIDGATKWVAA